MANNNKTEERFKGIIGSENKETENKQRSTNKFRTKRLINENNQYTSWLAGIAMSILPLAISLFLAMIPSSNKFSQEIFAKFYLDFITEGSYLWVSITLLGMSIVDIWIQGRKKTDALHRKRLNKVILLSCILCIFGIVIFFLKSSSSAPVFKAFRYTPSENG